MASQADIIALIAQKAKAFAAAQGRPDWGDAFARAAVAIAYGESGLRPDAVRDTSSGYDPLVASGQARREVSVGLFQNNLMGGRGTGYTAEQLREPGLNIDISLPSLWSAFAANGGAPAFAADPVTTTARTYQQGQGSVAPSIQSQVMPGLALTGAGVPASQTPLTLTGGAAMPSPNANGTTTANAGPLPRAVDPFVQGRIDAIAGRIKEIGGQRADIQRRIAALPPGDFAITSLQEQDAALSQEQIRLDAQMGDWWKIGHPEKAETPSQQANTMAGLINAQTGMLQAMFGNTVTGLKMAQEFMQANYDNAVKQVDQQIAIGKVRAEDRANIIAAYQIQQNYNLLAAGKGLEIAGFIQKGRLQQYERMLPPGQMYQDFFGPDAPMNQALQRLGVAPMVIRAIQIDPSSIDPVRNLQEGADELARRGAGPLDLSRQIADLQTIAGQNDTLQPAPYTPMAVPDLQGPDLTPYLGQLQELYASRFGGTATPPGPQGPVSTDAGNMARASTERGPQDVAPGAMGEPAYTPPGGSHTIYVLGGGADWRGTPTLRPLEVPMGVGGNENPYGAARDVTSEPKNNPGDATARAPLARTPAGPATPAGAAPFARLPGPSPTASATPLPGATPTDAHPPRTDAGGRRWRWDGMAYVLDQ